MSNTHILLLNRTGASVDADSDLQSQITASGGCLYTHAGMVTHQDHAALVSLASTIDGSTIVENLRVQHTGTIKQIANPVQGQLTGLDIIGRYNKALSRDAQGDGVVVASIDDGVSTNHTEFIDRYLGHWYGINPDTGIAEVVEDNVGSWVSDDGTATIGSMCGKSVGVAPLANFTFIKLFNRASVPATIADLLAVFDVMLTMHASNARRYRIPHVFNCAFTSAGSPFPASAQTHPTSEQHRVIRDFDTVIRHIYRLFPTSIFVFPAGNSNKLGYGANQTIELPARLATVTTVGSIRCGDSGTIADCVMSPFSAYGPSLSATSDEIGAHHGYRSAPGADRQRFCLAPGERITTTCSMDVDGNSGYVMASGTSISSAVVCGVIACMWSQLFAMFPSTDTTDGDLSHHSSAAHAKTVILNHLRKRHHYHSYVPNTVGAGLGIVSLDQQIDGLIRSVRFQYDSNGRPFLVTVS